MDSLTITTDEAYEGESREAERGFRQGLKECPEMPNPRIHHNTDKFSDDGERLNHVNEEVLSQLGRLCIDYAVAELRAYARLCHRSRIPTVQVVDIFRRYVSNALEDMRASKWKDALMNTTGLFTFDEPGEREWNRICAVVRSSEKLVEGELRCGFEESGTEMLHSHIAVQRPTDEGKARRQGRPQTIPDERKQAAALVKESGGSNRDAAARIYATKYPTPQQVKNVPSILRAHKKKASKQAGDSSQLAPKARKSKG
jgi:hypothetical protein